MPSPAPRFTLEMDVALQYFDGCPNWEVARSHLREALEAEGGRETEVRFEVVENADHAERLGFRGSPTILVDGVDPFETEDAPVGFSCRIFQTETGMDGSPSVAQLRKALSKGA